MTMAMVRARAMARGVRQQLAAATSTRLSMDRGKLASMRHHSNIQKLKEAIWDEVDIALSIDKECPYLLQSDYHRYWNKDYKSLKEYLHHLRTFNLQNKDADAPPRVTVNDNHNDNENYGFVFMGRRINTHLKALTPAEIQQDEKELAEERQKQALEIAHKIINRFNKDQSIKCRQKVKLEFVRLVRVVDTHHRLVRRIVVEASNLDAGIPFPPIIRLEATYNWYTGKLHRPSYLPPPYPDAPAPAPAPSSHSLEVHAGQEACAANMVVAAHEHNVAASTQAATDPIRDKTKRHEIEKFYDETEVKSKELKHLHEKEVEKKVLGKGHSMLGKDDKKSRVEVQSGVQPLQNGTDVLRDEIKLLREESLRKEQEAKERDERLEKKIQLIMDKLHLTA